MRLTGKQQHTHLFFVFLLFPTLRGRFFLVGIPFFLFILFFFFFFFFFLFLFGFRCLAFVTLPLRT